MSNTLPSELDSIQPSFGLPAFPKKEQPVFTDSAVPFQSDFLAASQRYGVPVNVIMGLAEQESSFNPQALGVPTAYGRAKGIMQYIDSTASRMGINPYDPVQSIDAAAKQLRERLDKGYSMEEAVKAHFAGDDRKQWGPKTAAYGQEVLARAEKFLSGNFTAPAQTVADVSATPEAVPGQMATPAFDTQAIFAELNKDEPDRYRPLTEEEMQRISQHLTPELQQDALSKSVPGVPIEINIPEVPAPGEAVNVQPEQPQGNEEGNLLTDAGLLLASGLNNTAKNLRELVGKIPGVGKSIVAASDRADRWLNGKSTEEIFKSWDKTVEEGLTPEMIAARKKAFVVEPGDKLEDGKESTGYNLGPAWSDPRTYMSGIVESLPEMAVTMGGAGRLAQMSYKAALKRGATKEAAAKSAATTATIAGGILEGSLAGAQTARSVRDAIIQMDEEQLKDSEALATLMEDGKSFDDARADLAENAASQAFVIAGLATGAFGGFGDRALVKIITDKTGGRLKSAFTGALGEGLLEEVPQSAAQQMAENKAMQEADPNIALMKGVPNAAASGLAIGSVMGGGLGAIAPKAGDQQSADRIEPTIQQDPTPKGPLSSAVDEGVQASADAMAKQPVSEAAPADDEFMGPVGGETLVVPADDPNEKFNAKVVAYRNGNAVVEDANGERYELSPTEVIRPDAQPVKEAEQPAAEPAQAAEPVQTPEPLKAADKPLDQMSEQELRDRLKYVNSMGKQNGWDKRLATERKIISSAIDSLRASPQSEEQPADQPVKWFGSAEKANGFIQKKNLAATHEVVPVGNSRFEIREKPTDKTKSPHFQRSTKLVGPEGAVLSPSMDIGFAKAGGKYVVEQIDKDGTVHLGDQATNALIKLTRQEIEKIRPNGIKWDSVASTVAEKPKAQPEQQQQEWQQFPSDSGSLGIPRSDMPQVKAEHRGAMVNYLNARGVAHTEQSVPADSLKPTQGEYSTVKVQKAKYFEGGSRSILVSADGYVLDGHHQWMAAKEQGQEVKAIRLDAPITDLIDMVKEFPSSTVDTASAAANQPADDNSVEIQPSEPAAAGVAAPKKDKYSKKKWIAEQLGNPSKGDKVSFSVQVGSYMDANQDYEVVSIDNEGAYLKSDNGSTQISRSELALAKRKGLVVTVKKPSSDQAAVTQSPEADTAPQSVQDAPARPAVSENKIFTEDAAEKARQLLRSKLSQLNSGIDPEIMQAGITLAGYHIEKGARTFSAFAQAMIADLGDMVRPYLKSWYMGVKYDPRATGFEGMSSAADVEAADINSIKAESNEPDTAGSVEQDSAIPDNAMGEGLSAADRSDKLRDDERSTTERLEKGRAGRGNSSSVSAAGTADAGTQANQPVAEQDEQSVDAPGVAGGSDSRGNSKYSNRGVRAERQSDKRIREKAESRERQLNERGTLQAAADAVPVVTANDQNIRETLPLLSAPQQDDVIKAEKRLFTQRKKGMMFTNGTGTGKTYTALGVIKRTLRRGSSVLVVSPAGVTPAWAKGAKDILIDEVHTLSSKTDSGKPGLNLTSFQNFRDNQELLKRNFDLVVYDESHHLMASMGGDETTANAAHKALTGHPDYVNVRGHMAMKSEFDAYTADADAAVQKLVAKGMEFTAANRQVYGSPTFKNRYDKLNAAADKLSKQLAKEKVDTKVLFLSASPFSGHKSVFYADGYLFDSKVGAKTSQAYNTGSAEAQFLVNNFGYRMRYNRVTQPGAEVDVALLERDWADRMFAEGSMSGRTLELENDYSREFAVVAPGIGKAIDDAFKIIDWKNYPKLNAQIVSWRKGGADRQLTEALRARAALQRIQQHLDMGRKVVVFHERQTINLTNPFDFKADDAETVAEINRLKAANPEIFRIDLSGLQPAPAVIGNQFGDLVGYFSGQNKSTRDKDLSDFNNDDGTKRILVIQKDAGKEGLSAHDITGKYQRALMILNTPVSPADAIQMEGRVYRHGLKSDAVIEYPTIQTSFEKTQYRDTVSSRTSTAENLAMGSQARSLREAFREGYLDPATDAPNAKQGKGGRSSDRAGNGMTMFDRAKTYYFRRAKKTSKTKAQEGTDYFATPEPLGFKMVEWAGLLPGEKVLEPSAGHGAIARWFPESVDGMAIEQSSNLSGELGISTGAEVRTMDFEDFNTINKFNAVVMNPPFGVGGSTAIKHIEKAVKHLRDGGRIIAIYPNGPAADKKFNEWYEGAAGVYVTATINLPTATFERAGTSVSTRILVIDKNTKGTMSRAPVNIDLSNLENINELFDRIKSLEVPERPNIFATAREAGLNESDITKLDKTIYRAALSEFTSGGKAKQVGKKELKKLAEKFGAEVSKSDASYWDESFYDFETKADRDRFYTAVVDKADELKNPQQDNTRYSAKAQTETEAFKRWFGDSKVVDESGKPLVVYHGTMSDIVEFDPAKNSQIKGMFFTAEAEYANRFASGRGSGANVLPVYLSIKNPIVIPVSDYNMERLAEASNDLSADGVIVKDDDGSVYVAIAFEPQQIKSATGNDGTFDPANPDIRYGMSAEQVSSTPSEGMPLAQVQAIANKIVSEFTGDMPLRMIITQTQDELYGPAATEQGIYIKGAYHPERNAFTLIADNLDNPRDVRKTIIHEFMAHYGLDTFDAESRQELLQKVIDSRGTKDKPGTLWPMWDKISSDPFYGAKSEIIQAEEVFAHTAESTDGKFQEFFDSIRGLIIRALRKLGLIKSPLTNTEIRQVIRSIAQGIRNGSRSKQSQYDEVKFNQESAISDYPIKAVLDAVYSGTDSFFNDSKFDAAAYNEARDTAENEVSDTAYDQWQNGKWQVQAAAVLNAADKQKFVSSVYGQTMYHGTAADFEGSTPALKSNGAAFAAKSKDAARQYAGEDGTIKTFKVYPKNPLIINDSESTWDIEQNTKLIGELKAAGYDSIIGLDNGDMAILSESVFSELSTADGAMFSQESDDFLTDIINELSEVDEMFQYPKAPKARNLQEVFDTILPGTKVLWSEPQYDDNMNETGVTLMRADTPQGAPIKIYQTPDEVWFDVSEMKPGERGSAIYQSVAEYALNTGRVFIGDPAGLSDIAVRRRTEAMLSSAIKHMTTKHLEPHARQVEGVDHLGIPPLSWTEGKHIANIHSMIKTSLANIYAKVPEIKRAGFDFKTRTFRNSKGEQLSNEVLDGWASKFGRMREAGAGSSTLKRAIILQSLLRTESSQRPGVLEQILRQRGKLLSDDLSGVFYSQRPTNKEVDSWFNQKWEATKELTGDALTSVMPALLHLTPGRTLLTRVGKDIPALAHYADTKLKMDTFRDDWHAITDKLAQRWQKYRVLNSKENSELMDIMHESTLRQVDPSEKFKSILTPMDQKVLKEHKQGTEAWDAANERANTDATRQHSYNTLQQRFDKLSPEAKAIYQQVRNTYQKLADTQEQIVLDNIEKAMGYKVREAQRKHEEELQRIKDEGLKGKERNDAIEKADKALANASRMDAWNKRAKLNQLRSEFESNRLAGPYFPLSRFGDFFVTARDKKNGEVEFFSRQESARDQTRVAKELRAQGYDVETGFISKSADLRKQIPAEFVATIEDLLKGIPGTEETQDQVWQLFLERMPDISIRKNRIHRKGRAGFEEDALRAFASHMFHGAHQTAKLKYSMALEDLLDEAKRQVKNTRNPTRSGMVLEQANKSHQYVMNPTSNAISQIATQGAFIWYLAQSPAAALLNMAQTVIVGPPKLAAFYDKGTAQGLAMAIGQINRALFDLANGKTFAENSPRVTAEEKAAVAHAYRVGLITRTQSHDVAGIADSGIKYSPIRAKIMAGISWMFHHTERVNREATFLAAYRVAKKKGLQGDNAIHKAMGLTWDIHYDYQNTSRPAIMHSNTGKALLVFRNYSLNMISDLAYTAYEIINPRNAQERREARTQMIGLLGTLAFNAGIRGLPLYGMMMVIAGMFSDDGEDPEIELKKSLLEYLPASMVGMMMDGVPGYTLGVEISSRIGFGDLWFRTDDRDKEGDSEFLSWVLELLGASASIPYNIYKGIAQINEGYTWRGLENILPKMIKDPMKSFRYVQEGVTTKHGDPIVDEVGGWDIFKQAIGVTPARIAEQHKMNSYNMNKQHRILTQQNKLLSDFYKAWKEGDSDKEKAVLAKMNEFSNKYPEMAIDSDSIRQSLKRRERYRGQNVGGMNYNQKLLPRLQGEQPGTVYR